MTAALIAKLESASEGSRELDAAVASVFSHDVESDDGDFWWGAWNEQSTRVPDFTTSIDAALALAERKGFDALLVLESAIYRARRHGQIPTTPDKIARFVCAAILRASAAQGAGRAE